MVGENCIGTYSVTLVQGGGPADVAIQNVGRNSGEVTWTAVPGTGVTYNLRYRVVGSSTWNVISNLTTTSYNLGSLLSGTNYEVAVQTVCIGGSVSQWSSPRSFTTLQGQALCAAPTGVRTQVVNSTAVTLQWTAQPSAACYIVSYGEAGTNTVFWNTQTVAAPTTSTILAGLTPGVRYEVRIRANCTICSQTQGQLSAWTPNVPFTMPGARQSGIAGLEINDLSVYPNPNNGVFTVAFAADAETDAEIVLTDVSGKAAYRQQTRVVAGENNTEVFTEELPAGVYILRLSINGELTTPVKIVIN